MSIVIGVDPDSEKHGIAIYKDGELASLHKMTLVEIADGLSSGRFHGAKWSVEDLMCNQFVYGRNTQSSKAAQSKIAMYVGRCQQSFVELIRILDHYEVDSELHKPQRGNWAKNKALFEMTTGWTGSSNEDTRSAAFMGYLALNK